MNPLSVKEILLDTPLYIQNQITENDFSAVLELEFFEGTLDVFCPQCGRDSVFNSTDALYEQGNLRRYIGDRSSCEGIKRDYKTDLTGSIPSNPSDVNARIDRFRQYALSTRMFGL